MDRRLVFELWKWMQMLQEPTRLDKENQVLAQPYIPRPKPVILNPVAVPEKAVSMPSLLSVRTSSNDNPSKSNEMVTLAHLEAFQAKSERMPFVLVWSIIYQHLLIGRSQTPSNAFYSLKKINTQEKLEDELNKAGLIDENDMVYIEGLIEKLQLRQAHKHRHGHGHRHRQSAKLNTRDMSQPSHVLEHVFLGSRANARDKSTLLELGITHILNVTPARTIDPVAGVPNFFEKDGCFTYRRCPLFDNKSEDILTCIEGCIAFIDQAQYYGRVLVHCKQGVSRSAAIVIAYVMRVKNLKLDEALAFVKEKRSEVQPNAGFLKQLCQFESRNKKKSTTQLKDVVKEQPIAINKVAIGPSLPPHLQAKASNCIGPKRKPDEELYISSKKAKTTKENANVCS
ncbi:hypothetical protein THRCLA_06901 [Thraustotheca clavata]|uniref:protein-tyrosine-phosphatase n=1 Tax=Thraustotheca clavata TaxID=74557 RepID=A0A1V9ZHV1_9STRA|nr:hypothetical protein THRCLA_06901 [Thraustotheca clavata]